MDENMELGKKSKRIKRKLGNFLNPYDALTGKNIKQRLKDDIQINMKASNFKNKFISSNEVNIKNTRF